jgi:putative peptidoglycan lipid II flippase
MSAPTLRRNSSLVAAGILLSRVSGLVREQVIAGVMGNGLAVDAFRAALRIPNVLQNLLGEGVLSASFIPVYSRLLAEGRRAEAGRVAGAVAGLLAAVTGGLVLLGVLAAGPITAVLAPGFDGERQALTVTLVRILFPGIGFLALSAWCLGVLNSHRRFFLSYVAPVLWNTAAIAALTAAALAGAGEADLATALSWGILLGGVLQFAVQLPAVLRLEPDLRIGLRTGDPATRQVLRAFGPVLAGRGVVQLSGYVDLALASLLAAGAVAALGFAQTLYLLPISVFGMSVAAAELPELASRRHDVLSDRLNAGLERVAFFTLPTVLVYVLFGDLLVAALFQRGAFGPADSYQVWVILAAYSAGLPASTSSRLLQSARYATGDTRNPARIAAVRVLVSAALGAALMLPFDELLVPGAPAGSGGNLYRLGAVGLALGAAVGAWLEYGLLRARVRDVRLGGGALGRILLATLAAWAVAALARRLVPADLTPVLRALLVLAPAGLAYLAAAVMLRLDEARALIARLRRPHRG